MHRTERIARLLQRVPATSDFVLNAQLTYWRAKTNPLLHSDRSCDHLRRASPTPKVVRLTELTSHEFCLDCTEDGPNRDLADLLYYFERAELIESELAALHAAHDGPPPTSGVMAAYRHYLAALKLRPAPAVLGDYATEVELACWRVLEGFREEAAEDAQAGPSWHRRRPSQAQLLTWLENIGDPAGAAKRTPHRLVTVSPVTFEVDDELDELSLGELERAVLADGVPLPAQPEMALLLMPTDRFLVLNEERGRYSYGTGPVLYDRGPAEYWFARDQLRQAAERLRLGPQSELRWFRPTAS